MKAENNNIILTDLVSSGIDFLNIVISKDDVLKKDYSEPMKILNQLTSDINVVKHFCERVDIFFDGYNNTKEELWEIQEVRNYVFELDSLFPYWLYFLTKEGKGLFVILRCFLLPFLRPEAEKEINGKKLQNYLEKRGFPAMDHLCELTGVKEEEYLEMTNRFINYLQDN